MKTYKVNIPDTRIEFVTDLLKRFHFVTIEDFSPELVSTPIKAQTEQVDKAVDTSEDMSSLRNALENLNRAREHNHVESCRFRLPMQKVNNSNDEIKSYGTYEDLKKFLESYFRVEVDKLTFSENNENKAEAMDIFIVHAHIKESASKSIKMLAGYADNKLM